MTAHKAETSFSLRDHLFNQESVSRLAGYFAAAYSDFNKKAFIKATLDGFPDRELKDRIKWIREQLYIFLPDDYERALNIILQALPPELDPYKTDDDFGDFIMAAVNDYVASYGCQKNYLDQSLPAIEQLTRRFSAEDAIRSFINTFPDQTYGYLQKWASSDNYHVRRLVSEGTRPLLPWAARIDYTAAQTIPLLDQLYADPTRYVTRSVANHLNDISKSEPGLVVRTLKKWRQMKKQSASEMKFITQHALRTLLKQNYQSALVLLGFDPSPKISQIKVAQVPPQTIGEQLVYRASFRSSADQDLLLQLRVFFQGSRSNTTDAATLTRSKIFKLGTVHLKKGETHTTTKKISFRPMTTFALYPGVHRVQLEINGTPYHHQDFELLAN